MHFHTHALFLSHNFYTYAFCFGYCTITVIVNSKYGKVYKVAFVVAVEMSTLSISVDQFLRVQV